MYRLKKVHLSYQECLMLESFAEEYGEFIAVQNFSVKAECFHL